MAERSRTFGPTVLGGLVAAALTSIAAGRTWGTADTVVVGAHRQVEARGTDVAPLALALALVALAAWGIVLVTRVRARRLVSVVGLACSLGVLASVAATGHAISRVLGRLAGEPASAAYSVSPWYFVTGVAALACAVSFVAVWRLAPAWPAMGSRYDAPIGDAAAVPDEDPWRALDRGHDPTS